MRGLGLFAAAIALSAPGAAPAAPDDPGAVLRAAAEQCLRSNAARVTASTQTLTEAVTFLVEDLCSDPISRSELYQSSVRALAELQADPPKPRFTTSAAHPTLGDFEQQQNADAERQGELLKQVKVNPSTGELDTPPGFDPALTLRAVTMQAPIFLVMYGQADFKAIAAEAVLAAKEAAARR